MALRTLALLGATIGGLVLPAAAGAAGPDAAKLRAAGLAVTWPQVSGLGAGDSVVVRVKALRRDAAVARVSLVRVSRSGKPVKVVARRTLRRGTFRAKLDRAGAKYLLRVSAARVSSTRAIQTPAIATATPPPVSASPPVAPAPPPPPPAREPCAQAGTTQGEVVLGSSEGKAGDPIPMRLRNTGTGCLEYGSAYSWEQKSGDAWTTVPCTDECVFDAMLRILQPGATESGAAKVYGDMKPGDYRLVKRVQGRGGQPELLLTAPFRVTG
jgi:hypothetical protein